MKVPKSVRKEPDDCVLPELRGTMGNISRELAAILILLTTSSAALGGVCEESILTNRYIINCRSKNLEAVPDLSRYDKEYDELTLAQNIIVRIENAAFSGLRIKRLDLTGNQIAFVSPTAFQGLGQVLESLLISFGPALTEFPSQSLQELPGVRTLLVDGHAFGSLPQDSLANFPSLSSLMFTRGVLSRLTAEFFEKQQDTLTHLDLQFNEFSAVPTQELAQLRSLKYLNLAGNRVSRFNAGSFRGLSLEVLDLSTQNQPVSVVDENAFRGLETSLKNLSLASLSLTNENVRALRHLTGVIDLDLSRNKITNLDGLFVSLRSLVRLNLQDNPIARLGSAPFADAGSIRILNLASNNISIMDPEAFVGLTSLEDLDLGYSNDLTLNDESFKAQRTTLKFLKLQSANLRSSQWTAITKLYELQDLFLSRCGLSNIPDYTFQEMKKLRSIDLRNNEIKVLSQKSLSGLEGTLEILNLLGNQIRTIDSCVFHGFTRLNLFQLSLQHNPLQCVCGLNWLHVWFVNVTGNDNYQKGRISWTCDDLNGSLFRDLTYANFSNCLTTEAPCEDMSSKYTTELPGGDQGYPNSRPAIVSLWVVNSSSDSVTLQWDVNVNDSVEFSLTYDTNDGAPTTYFLLGSHVRIYQVEKLKPDTSYRMCLEIRGADAISCLNVTTSGQPLNLMLIYGASIGAGVAIIVLVLLIIVCCCISASSSRSKHDIVPLEQPKLGNNTKRFQKPQTLEPEPMSRTKSIAEQLESLTDEERYRLVNLLTHSGGSIASLDFSVHSLPRQRAPGGYSATLPPVPCGQPRYVLEPQKSRCRYDDVPVDDDYYEEISVDEIV